MAKDCCIPRHIIWLGEILTSHFPYSIARSFLSHIVSVKVCCQTRYHASTLKHSSSVHLFAKYLWAFRDGFRRKLNLYYQIPLTDLVIDLVEPCYTWARVTVPTPPDRSILTYYGTRVFIPHNQCSPFTVQTPAFYTIGANEYVAAVSPIAAYSLGCVCRPL